MHAPVINPLESIENIDLMPDIKTEVKGSLEPTPFRSVEQYFNPQTFDLNKPRGVNFMETCEERKQ